MGQPFGDLINKERRGPHPISSGLALLSADEWRDVAPCLDYYNNVRIRFVSGALNRLVRRNLSTLPLRVIAALVVANTQKGYSASAFKADLRTLWRDLVYG
ncbi:hypothetical protein AAVH_18646, partial [Aphelenchoides avenae]